MVVVLMVVDGWWGRIDDLKLRWPATIVAFFPARWGSENDENHRGFSLQHRRNLLWWCGGWRRPESGDRMREKECRWEQRESPRLRYGVNACMVHRYRWTLCAVGSRMKRSDGCDWLDLQVDRTVWMSWSLIWCGAVPRKIGTPDDVAQRDQILDYFNG